MTIKLIFLGTSDAIPSAERNHTAVLLSYGQENILVDCGEGTQRQFRKAGLNPCKINRILITHWHGDHVLGLPGLLQTLAFTDYKKTLFVYGPRGTKKFMKLLLRTFVFQNRISIKIEEIDVRGKFLETPDFYIEAEKMTHGTPCNAYAFVKKGQLRINKEKLEKSGLPKGPILARLKKGRDVMYKGKKYKAKDLTYREGDKKVCFVLDTTLNENVVGFAKGSNLLISEATFSDELKDKARKHKHLTSKQAAEIAKKAKVKKLVLMHISKRYAKDFKKILNEAKKVFGNSVLVNDLDEVKV